MKIVIVKYNAGNIRSVNNALWQLGYEAEITDDPHTIQTADKVIFPGVGQAETTMQYLRATQLDRVIRRLTQPVLGICLGMQLLCSHSQEGDVECLGIFDLPVLKFVPPSNPHPQYKIPQMGWNTLEQVKGPLFDAEHAHSYMYFVHSYYVPLGKATIATTHYIQPYSSALQHQNFYATQFHPEKSGPEGLKILKNFLERT